MCGIRRADAADSMSAMAGIPASVAPPAPASTLRRVLGNRIALWAAFVLVHAELVWLALTGPGLPLGDVTLVYTTWMRTVDLSGYVVGIDGPFVYPILAIVPMALAALLRLRPVRVHLAGHRRAAERRRLRRAHRAAPRSGDPLRAGVVVARRSCVLLGPIAVGRIDAVTVPIALVAVLLVAGRPRLGAGAAGRSRPGSRSGRPPSSPPSSSPRASGRASLVAAARHERADRRRSASCSAAAGTCSASSPSRPGAACRSRRR